MKTLTNNEFTKACRNVIKNMSYDEIVKVHKGLVYLIEALKRYGNTLDIMDLDPSAIKNKDSNSAFLCDLRLITLVEIMYRELEHD